MTWLRIDDGFVENEKVEHLSHPAFRLHVGALCLCARLLTDGKVTEKQVKKVSVGCGISSAKRYVNELVEARLWAPRAGGWQIKDYLQYNPSSEEVREQRASNARRQALFRDPALRKAIRDRDGDLCRYCGEDVHWNDKRGPSGATYDHVDPAGPNTIGNLVVCCRSCNARKCNKTPEEAGMVLRPIQVGFKSDLVSSTTPSRPVIDQELPTRNGHVDVAFHKLLRALGPVDEEAMAKLRGFDARLPEASIARVTESVITHRPRNRVGYALKALSSELSERNSA